LGTTKLASHRHPGLPSEGCRAPVLRIGGSIDLVSRTLWPVFLVFLLVGVALASCLFIVVNSHDGRPVSVIPTPVPTPPEVFVNDVAGAKVSGCWNVKGTGSCWDGALTGREPFVSEPLRLTLPKLPLQEVTVRFMKDAQTPMGHTDASVAADGTILIPAGKWKTLLVLIMWRGTTPQQPQGDGMYAWSLSS
jgi:hypothetical protein